MVVDLDPYGVLVLKYEVFFRACNMEAFFDCVEQRSWQGRNK